MTKNIRRITLFKIPKTTDQERLLSIYKTLQQEAQKDGKPYILSVQAGKAFEDQRSQGYTLAVQTEFSSLDDMKFYDEDCSAHQSLKGVVKTLQCDGAMTVYFESIFD